MFINLNKLNQNIIMIQNDFKYYEASIYDLLSEIKNTFYFWNDGYTQHFFRNVDKGIQDVDTIVDSLDGIIEFLNNLKSVYFMVYNKQKEVVDKNNMVVNSDNFNILETDSDEIKEKKKEIGQLIKENEENISYLISRLSKPLVQIISFDNLEILSDRSKSFVGMREEMDKKVPDIQSRYNNFKIYSDKIVNDFSDIRNCYSSKNTKRIVKYIRGIVESAYMTDSNLNSAVNYIVYRHNEIRNKLINKLLFETSNFKGIKGDK